MLLAFGCRKAAPDVSAPAALSDSSSIESPADAPVHFAVRGRWQDPAALTYRIEPLREAAFDPPIAPGAWRDAVRAACATWSQLGVVGFVELLPGDAAEADVTLGFRRGRHGACEPFGVRGNAAHSGPVARGTYVHFDAAQRWCAGVSREAGVFSVQATALHELGHVLGIGHSLDERAVMRVGAVANAPVVLSRSDRCAIWSLYGSGSGAVARPSAAPRSDSLVIQRVEKQGELLCTLHGVAWPDVSCFAVFDADGDQRDDVLVWRTDRAGSGVLMVYHFRRESGGCRLARTTGPWFGIASASGQSGVLKTDAGERLFVTRFDSGRVLVRRFDEHARLAPFDGGLSVGALGAELLERVVTQLPRVGDLDGDGLVESVSVN
ncbi:MAG: matrixin family metalloprotease [Planctomycetota bacterium]